MTKLKYLVFDLETIPDLKAAEILIPAGKDLDDIELRRALGERYARPDQAPEDAFVKSVLHRIVAIGVFGMDEDGIEVMPATALARPEMTERQMLEKFDGMLAKDVVLISFNGAGFDLPVLRHRAIATETRMPNLLSGSDPLFRSFGRSRNYFLRYGTDHVDLLDRLSNFGAATRPNLEEALAIIGEQAKGEVSGGDVEELARNGDWDRIANYVKRDVEMTALLFRAWLQAHRPDEEDFPTRTFRDRGR
jgi:predicted PolB exonuclease-like 3'-5' exonuclease